MKRKAQQKLTAESYELKAGQAGNARLRLDLAFVGTGLCGWQVQARGTTVQGLVDGALRAVGHGGTKVVGCSRTDSGVHARTFTAHVDTDIDRPLGTVLSGLNANLPPQVRVYRVSRPGRDFHARYACTLKRYRYHLFTGAVVPPPVEPYVWPWRGRISREALGDSAALFLGEHDFSAFTTADGRERNTRRTVTECRWEERGELLVLHVSGPSFLHRMVRCMGGAMIGAGTGRLSLRDIRSALAGDLSGPQIPALPAQGLALWEVEYPAEATDLDSAGGIPEGLLFPL